FLIVSLFLLAVSLAQTTKEQEKKCAAEVTAKMQTETDFWVKMSLITGMVMQSVGDDAGLTRTFKGLSLPRK
ncbi:hypothetical protein PENTCL1PPCAC_12196, partial [Pristionchus entomophagus]